LPGTLLQLGLSAPLHIREERLRERDDPTRLLYISDIHLRRNRSALLTRQVLTAVRECVPHAILLGGDLIDARSELPQLSELVHQLSSLCPVVAVGGNHDVQVGLGDVDRAVSNGGGIWIHRSSYCLRSENRRIVVSGPDCDEAPGGDVRVLCAHNPRIWKTAQLKNFDLVLAGHLHGCQVVAFEYRNRLYPGAVFYPYNCLSREVGDTRLIVSRGVSDLVPIRWRCPREVVLCYV